jgi:hypothetical protein
MDKTTSVPDVPALDGKFSVMLALSADPSVKEIGTEVELTPLSVALIT